MYQDLSNCTFNDFHRKFLYFRRSNNHLASESFRKHEESKKPCADVFKDENPVEEPKLSLEEEDDAKPEIKV